VQLARAGVTENVFSLCYGFPQGGSMLLGGSMPLKLPLLVALEDHTGTHVRVSNSRQTSFLSECYTPWFLSECYSLVP
jgi:hypothetical protein